MFSRRTIAVWNQRFGCLRRLFASSNTCRTVLPTHEVTSSTAHSYVYVDQTSLIEGVIEVAQYVDIRSQAPFIAYSG